MKFYTSVFCTIVLLIFVTSCMKKFGSSNLGPNNNFIKVSQKNPRYFEKADGDPWIPIMINFIVPNGEENDVFNRIETYFKTFSENGGDAVRIWISSPFLEIEDKSAGLYNPAKFKRIDKILELAEKYKILIKFTLQHIRTIEPDETAVSSWSNRSLLHIENGGPFFSIDNYINTSEGKRIYLNRVKALAEKYRNHNQIFSWELWNEMDAVDTKGWYPFTLEILDSVKALLPNHIIAQTLGSLHSKEAEDRYELLLPIKSNEYISVHRYLDQGTDWGQYEYVKGPIDLLIASAVQFAYRSDCIKPVVANEHGAVEGNHSGPHKLYQKDSLGVFIHDMIFAPFFCGASGCGAMWHWDSYIMKQNLWYHYQRFCNIIKGINPVEEQFIPFTYLEDSVRFYGLKGNKTTMIWLRDARNNWITELQQGIAAKTVYGLTIDSNITGKEKLKNVKIYDPWIDKWTEIQIHNNKFTLPDFKRSLVLKFI